jgi:outer membrane receptor protein involved in Fe transport
MTAMPLRCRPAFLAGCLFALPLALRAQTQTPGVPTTDVPGADFVVSANKMRSDAVAVPASVSVVSGAELRRHGAKTIAEALQDVAGIDTGSGSDDGSRVAVVGIRGLRNPEAFLVTIDGVPAGGPFASTLAAISIEDVERIEIVRGPQGTRYGVSAFAGLIQVFTRRPKEAGATLTLGGGSLSDKHANLSYAASQGQQTVHLFGSIDRNHGFQDGTNVSSDRLSIGFTQLTKDGSVDVTLGVVRDTNYFGSPLPVWDGVPLPGFDVDRNYAIGGGRLDHRVYSLSSTLSQSLSSGVKLENTLGLARDQQITVRSFILGYNPDLTAVAAGSFETPLQTTIFDDARIVASFSFLGKNRLVAGLAYTMGRTTLSGEDFAFPLVTGPAPVVPTLDQVTPSDQRIADDSRTFWGLYANDEWTPFHLITFTLGARWDHTSETEDVNLVPTQTQTPQLSGASRTDGKWSWGLAAVVKIVDTPRAPVLDALNLYASLSSSFQPASANIDEARTAQILDPERIRSSEIGLKTRWAGGRLTFNVALFHMEIQNVAFDGASLASPPGLENVGAERLQGVDTAIAWAPPRLEGFSASVGYGHHDATWVHFSYVDPIGELTADGERLVLVPRNLWNARLAYAPKTGFGLWAAVRHEGTRPLDIQNEFYTNAFYEWDAGASYEFPWGRVSLVGRNLKDDRHYVSASELAYRQFYVSPPRRFLGEITFKF